MEPRVFTIEEVNALIPRLAELVGQQLMRQSDIERRLAELSRLTREVPRSLEPEEGDASEMIRLKDELRGLIARYQEGWRRVQELGAVIKDPQTGLLDFYGRIEGRLVWLCWRYGEEALGYYHELHAGYSGRRPLGPMTRDRLLN